MRKKTVKPLLLNKETLRNLLDLPGTSLEEAAGGTYPSYVCTNTNCISDCGGDTHRYCCL